MSTSWKTNRPGGLTLTETALNLSGFAPGDAILEAGCGFGATGRFLRQSRDLRVVGLDRDLGRLNSAGKAFPVTCARLPDLPFSSEAFHGIFCECVLSLVADKARCLAEFNRVLKTGGTLVLTDLFLPENMATKAGQGPGRDQGATCIDGALPLPDLTAAVRAAGFDIRITQDHTGLLKQMACEMVFEHGSLDSFWSHLTGTDLPSGLTGLCRTGCLKPGYGMVIATKYE